LAGFVKIAESRPEPSRIPVQPYFLDHPLCRYPLCRDLVQVKCNQVLKTPEHHSTMFPRERGTQTFQFVVGFLHLAEIVLKLRESFGSNTVKQKYLLIRPPVYGSNGRTYKMLVMFFSFFLFRPPVYGSNERTYKMLVMFSFFISFFSPRVLGVPSTDRPETLSHGRNLA